MPLGALGAGTVGMTIAHGTHSGRASPIGLAKSHAPARWRIDRAAGVAHHVRSSRPSHLPPSIVVMDVGPLLQRDHLCAPGTVASWPSSLRPVRMTRMVAHNV